MRRSAFRIGVVLALALAATFTDLPASEKKVVRRDWNRGESLKRPRYDQFDACDGYMIVRYHFQDGTGTPDWQGWTRVDNTAQQDTFWHVDTADIEGTKAWVLGVEGDMGQCGWASPGGYGNNWDQSVGIVPDVFQSDDPVRVRFMVRLDTEPGSDYLAVEADSIGGEWFEIARFSGRVDETVELEFDTGGWLYGLRFRFISDESFSPEDDPGPWGYGGSISVDSIKVTRGEYILDEEDCEGAEVGDRQTDGDENSIWWIAAAGEPHDMYSGLDVFLPDHDPCDTRYYNAQVVFFEGSAAASTEYPGLLETPYGDSYGRGQDEMIVSPVIDLARYATNGDNVQDAAIPPADEWNHDVKLYFSVYRDLPLENLVFYYWRVRSKVGECFGPWRDRGYLYYAGSSGEPSPTLQYDGQDFLFAGVGIGDLVDSDSIQVAVGVVDMSGVWYDGFGPVTEHTPAPWFDNVQLKRCDSPDGPVIGYREVDLFQDNFPSSETNIESWVRADMAADIGAPGAGIHPGDSIVISCNAPRRGMGTIGADDRAMVYMNVRCTYIGPDPQKEPLYGQSLEGTYGRYADDDGEWTRFIADSARIGDAPPKPHLYCFDLNDSLLTRGYLIEYYFEAYDAQPDRATLPEEPESVDDYPYRGGSNYFEFTCLPTGSSDILYVDDFDGRGCLQGVAQLHWDAAFDAVLEDDDFPDRYDINGPSSLVGNGLASRTVLPQLCAFYNWIVWDSGNLRYGTVSDGDSYRDTCDDIDLLEQWAENNAEACGIWFAGDNIAHEVRGPEMLSGVTVRDSYFAESGEPSPLLTCDGSGILDSGTFRLTGGCPIVNAFDVFDAAGYSGPGIFDMEYESASGSCYAAYCDTSTNPVGAKVKKLWTGFSLIYLHDDDPEAPIARNRLVEDVFSWWGGTAPRDSVVGDDTPPPYSNFLRQNAPNPFNPSTTIGFGVRKKGAVSLRVYDVSGRLIRTLVDDTLEAGPRRVTWDGRNDRGRQVASGFYFYRLTAPGYVKTRKMVLLR